MADQNTHIEQVLVVSEPKWDPNKPAKRLALFDEEGSPVYLGNFPLELESLTGRMTTAESQLSTLAGYGDLQAAFDDIYARLEALETP